MATIEIYDNGQTRGPEQEIQPGDLVDIQRGVQWIVGYGRAIEFDENNHSYIADPKTGKVTLQHAPAWKYHPVDPDYKHLTYTGLPGQIRKTQM